jgi:hypothetical protein
MLLIDCLAGNTMKVMIRDIKLASCLGAWLAILGCSGQHASTTCEAGETQACLCVGVESGVQICEDDGSRWGDCLCVTDDTATDEDVIADTANDFDVADDIPVDEDVVQDTSDDLDDVPDTSGDTVLDAAEDTIADVPDDPILDVPEGEDLALDPIEDAEDAEGHLPVVVGTLDISFDSGFIYDQSRLSETGYMAGHPEGLDTDGAFSGDCGAIGVIPPTLADSQQALAIRFVPSGGDPPFIAIQESYHQLTTVLDPIVIMQFPDDAVTVGTWGLDISGAMSANLLVIDDISTGSPCVWAIAIGGTMTVTTAVDTTLDDGGQLAFEGTGVPLYRPVDTPRGDVTSALVSAGWNVCW